jgi:GrpB-like predicted nucleotidyltransferase (UPF0157 family)
MGITISSYDARWPGEFRAIAATLRAALGDRALRIDHIGSTAVSGLAAKDKIDIQVTVRDFASIASIVAAISAVGYISVGEMIMHDHRPPSSVGPEADWEKSLLSALPERRPTNIHIRAAGRPNQRYPLLFRDYLRCHPVALGAYAEIKRQLARYHPDDQDFYYDIKDPVCDVIIDAAEEWAQHSNWQQESSDA